MINIGKELSSMNNHLSEHLPAFDLTFCFEAIIIIDEALSKLNYIGNFTYSNSASTMSKSIGLQIDKLMKRQQELEKNFDRLILEKTAKTELVDEINIKQLIEEIKECAEELKTSTNNICKSLSENPDIPVNLKKAKDDKLIIKTKLENIRDDLVCANFIMFNKIIEEIKRNSIDIDSLRKTEMSLFQKLRSINEDLNKEEEEYQKDMKNLNSKLTMARKDLAKTKMKTKVLKDYRVFIFKLGL